MRHLKAFLILTIFVFSVSFVFAQRDIEKGIEAYELGEYSTAKDFLKSGYTKIKGDKELKADVTYMIAQCYRFMKNTKVAESWYKKSIKRGYKDPDAILNYADMLKMNEKYDEAVIEYKNYMEKVADDERGEYGVKSCELASVWKKNPTRHKVEAMAYFNDRETDFSPAFGKKDYKVVYFSSSREGTMGDKVSAISGINYTDIFMTSKDRKGKWSVPVPIGPPVNSELDEGACCMNKKANIMFFSRCPVVKHEKMGCQIFTATKKGQGWGEPTLVPIADDSIDIKYPSLSKDELKLYFTADIPGGYGGADIWMIKRPKKTKPFGEPINLGPEINTFGDEGFPYTYDDSTLYFSSKQHLGMGGLDIFVARLQKDGKWEVENMKYPINTSSDDFGYIVEAKREAGFFTSTRPGGKGGHDIYYFEVPPLKFGWQGIVEDAKTGLPIVGAQIKIIGDNDFMLELVSEADGSGIIKNIPPDADYTISAIYDGYLLSKFSFSTKDVGENKMWTSNIILEEVPIDVTQDVDDIFYEFGEARLTPASKVALDSLVMFMEDNLKITVEIMSHTDHIGNDAANMDLSNRRAKSVVDYLEANGIEQGRLTSRGYGETVPHTVTEKHVAEYPFLNVGDVLTEDFITSMDVKDEADKARQVNRRTQFKILSADFETKRVPVVPDPVIDEETDEDDEDESEDDEN